MFYSLTFFNILMWVSLIGLVVNFAFQLWYNIVDFKNKNLW
ncbi:hypothetical protein J2S14_002285 [Lederbergia wuyishanensis]|uniref:ATP synthase F0 subunit 8 n=1 Tax=Lederbergia wuyishanensis TaxID=1347903 RepID=A0ABU0D4Z7_9BACI|nr:hypothetical protein [Lederbergia wuyishanensis]